MTLLQFTNSNALGQESSAKPIYPGSKTIRSQSLVVEMIDPEAREKYYDGVRFTPVAAIISAKLNGREFLFHTSKHDPKLDVAGLFSEFDLVTEPPGFADARQGEAFLKLGVGLLQKSTEKYQFYTQYAVDHLAKTTATWKEDSAIFEQTCDQKDGYGYRLETVVKVNDNGLSVDWKLANTGQLEIKTSHYTHNSFRFDQESIGPNYVLSFPFDFAAAGLRSDILQNGREISFSKLLEKPANLVVNYPEGYQGPNAFELLNVASHQKVNAITNITGERVALHVAGNYICPEQFVQITLKPGESKSWVRKYLFHTEKHDSIQPSTR